MLKKIKKNLSEVLNTFENIIEKRANAPFFIIFSNKNIMENVAFAPKEQMLHFP